MTAAYTFQVGMLVTVLAEDADTARKQLDAQGGFMRLREVALVSTVDLTHGGAE